MVQYADDSIRINEQEFETAFKKLPAGLRKDAAKAMTLLSMNLFYPEYSGKPTNKRANESIADPDAYLNNAGNETIPKGTP